ncbi:putative protein kinase RLK-Pelle-RLCK-II family [Helianthus annuus]|nr:putative protein kinase RLK-Pelle-RLCK-II family [Helianthus annuus]
MGCLTVLKGKKKKSSPSIHVKRVNPQDPTPTTLPEPITQTRALQSAPPSFRTRVKPLQPSHSVITSRMRALSAPSTLDAAEQDTLSAEYDGSGGGGGGGGVPPVPQPLPLPAPHTAANLKTMGSFKVGSGSGPLLPPQNVSGPLPLPPSGNHLPPTVPASLTSSGTLKNFSFEELAAACHYFSPQTCVSEGLSSVMYRASFGEDVSSSKNLQATVTSLHPSSQGLKEFVSEVNTLASLQHPYLCKLIGFHAREGSDKRMLVYERLFHGSLDRLLYGRTDGPPIDWNARMKVALCAAQGLTFCTRKARFR